MRLQICVVEGVEVGIRSEAEVPDYAMPSGAWFPLPLHAFMPFTVKGSNT